MMLSVDVREVTSVSVKASKTEMTFSDWEKLLLLKTVSYRNSIMLPNEKQLLILFDNGHSVQEVIDDLIANPITLTNK